MTSPDQLKTIEQKIGDLVAVSGVPLGIRLYGVLEANDPDQLVPRMGAFQRTAERVLKEGIPNARIVWVAISHAVMKANSLLAQNTASTR